MIDVQLRTRPAACVFFLAVTAFATPSAAQTFTIATSVGQDGRRYVYEISQERANGLPQWDQRAASEPPLSMSEAKKRAEAWLMSQTPEVKTFELSSASLTKTVAPLGSCRLAGCWFYRMNLDPVVAGRRLAGGGDFTAIVLMDGSIVEPRFEAAVPASPNPDAAGVYVAGNGVIAPRVLRQTKVGYTSDAMRAKIQGTVWLEAVVNTDGKVGDVKVSKSLDAVYGLDKEAVKTLKQWRFAPGTREGVPVPVRVTVEMTFSLH